MAINTLALDVPLNETCYKSKTSANCFKNPHGVSSRRLIKINLTANEESVCSSKGKRVKLRKNNENQCPYLMGDTIHSVTVERFFEETLVHKKGSEYSSFPLAANLYKASSDEFKNLKKKNNKKVKKSVLTLPNNPVPVPQLCTVSDRNDSDNSLKKQKKRPPNIRNKISPTLRKKFRNKQKEFGFYDRDAQYCTELNIDLDCSSTEIIKSKGGKKVISTRKSDNNNNISNVWAVLRNINQFQFRPSPPMSEDSFRAPVKKKGANRYNTRKDVRLVKATRAEEYEYISRFDVNGSDRCSKSYSSCRTTSESVDKITIVGKNNQNKFKVSNAVRGPINRLPIQNNKFQKRNNDKTVSRRVKNVDKKTPLTDKTLPLTTTLNTFGRKNIFGDIESSTSSTFAHGFDNNFCYNDRKNVNDTHVKKSQPIEFVYSENSGSSKAALTEEIEKNKIVFGGGYSSRPTTSPACKYGQNKNNMNEIRNKVARLKFPIVVLGRDQLSSSFEVNEGYSQFTGLDEAIWPFMVEWQENENRQKTKLKNPNSHKNRPRNGLCRKTDNENTSINKEYFKNEKSVMEPKVFIKNKTPQKKIISPQELDNQIILEKSKQIRQIKDKMFKFLSKSSSSQSFINEKKAGIQNYTKKESIRNSEGKMDVGTDTNVLKDPCREQIANNITDNIMKTNRKHPRGKGKWASEFIENVFRKIKNGVYYSSDNKAINKIAVLKDVHVQTMDDTIVPESNTIQPISTRQKPELLFVIPGFEEDNILPKFEIKSMNMKEISLKNCTTNIMVRFDVTVPTEPFLNSTKSNSLIPLTATESHTKVFKCKTNIINAMLPGELCSVLPSIMSNLNNSMECSAPQTPVNVEKPYLSPIPEISVVPEHPISLTFRNISRKLLLLLEGSYSMRPTQYLKFKIFDASQFRYGYVLVMDLLPNLQMSHFFDCNIYPIVPPVLIKPERLEVTLSSFITGQAECTALELYPASKRRLIPMYNRFDLAGILETFSRLCSVNWFTIQSRPWIDGLLNNGIKFMKLTTTNTNGFSDSIIFDVNKFVDTVFSSNSITQIDIHLSVNVVTQPRFLEIENEIKKNQNQALGLNSKVKRKRYVKLYRKCKSVSNISGDSTSTPLSRISDLNDFFLALGSGKMLAGVFDQLQGRKILSSLVQMKSWISEINPRQALLVLLLNNKKETPNLVRYQPVILQGIAMNRITQANELDMEIEVIERENMNKRILCEGISYLPASAENQDSLFEELCWIAKTTASDYQRTFDDSSKQLLKSLLQKRKKLNPSYLRVMARYVGLGLLRPPNKK